MSEVKRDGKGRWRPGVSGNPSGQPANTKIIRELLEPHRQALVDKVVEVALKGDVTALRTALERLAPLPRAEYPTVEVPGLTEAKSLTEKAEAVINAAAEGTISPDVAEKLLAGIAALAKVTETDELAKRIAELEARRV